MPYCMNLMPIGTSLYTLPGISANKIDMQLVPAAWQAGHAYALGATVKPSVANGFIYICSTAGTSAGTEPVWHTDGTTTPDNTVVWKSINANILKHWYVNLNGTNYHIIVLVGGALYKVSIDFVTATQVWPAAGVAPTFLTNPEIDLIGSSWLCMIDPTIGFLVYDGTTITQPTGGSSILGTTICYSKTRLFVGNGRTISYTDPLNIPPALADFNNCFTVTGSGSVVDPHGSLANSIQKLIASGEYIYVVGDHGTHIIYGVQLVDTGSTTFQLLESFPGIGSIWPNTVCKLGGAIYMMGDAGVFSIQGTQWESLSGYLDAIIPKIDTTFAPVGFFAKIYNKWTYCLIVRHSDIIDGNTIKSIWAYYEDRWFQIYYGSAFDFVFGNGSATSTSSSSFAAYGSKLVELFTGVSSTVRKFRTKSSNFQYPIHDKQVLKVGCQATNDVGLTSPITALITVNGDIAKASVNVTMTPATLSWVNSSGLPVTWTGLTWSYPFNDMLAKASCDGRGKRIQLEYAETSAAVYILTGIIVEGLLGTDW